MFVHQFYTSCISEYAYYIESNGEAAIIDPLRDIEEYLKLAKERNATIKFIFETHFHADFVSGHLDLAAATGATIVYGPNAKTNFEVYIAKDEEEFSLGNSKIKVLHTPGHTLESSCYLLSNEFGEGYAVFTGDTLFVGDVGRPDLSQNEEEHSKDMLAGLLYDSLKSKIAPLSDAILHYPGHGAGSNCGKNLGVENVSTIGEQKLSNYALQIHDKEEFIKAITEGLNPPPVYFPINAQINKEGYQSLQSVFEKGLQPIPLSSFKEQLEDDDVIILDTRPAIVFTNGFIPNSIFVGLEGRFAEWAASILPFDKPIILVAEDGKEKETITRLARVGFENIIGYLEGSFDTWRNAGEQIDLLIDVEADELAMDIPFDANMVILDVRKETEYGNGHLAEAINIPLENLVDPGNMADLDDHHNIYLHCGGGYRSVIAASLLKRQGIHNIRNVVGGWDAIMEIKDKFTIEKTESVLN